MDKKKKSEETATVRGGLLPIVASGFSLMALGIFLYVFLGDVEKELKEDAVYWFLIALAAAILPYLKQIRFKDLELDLREEISRNRKDLELHFNKEISNNREELDQRMDNLQAFTSSIGPVELSESKLSEEYREHRDRVFGDFNRRLKRADPDQRLSLQERFTRMHLLRFGITLSDVKTALSELGIYNGDITNEFDAVTVEAIGRFQEISGLEADGIFGPETYQRMVLRLTTQSNN